MNLESILKNIDIIQCIGSYRIKIGGINFNSLNINKKDLFVAIKGEKLDGHNYIDNAISKGAAAILCEYIPANINREVTYVQVDNSSIALAIASSNLFKNISSKIKIVGVTGTNGKTTTVSLLHQLFNFMGARSGMISTIENKIINTSISSTHTTPDVLSIYNLLEQMVEAKCEYCFMEVSSHAISQHRVFGLEFNAGVFTNLTHDHLDYHGTYNEYRDEKKKFFDSLCDSAFALINKDDKNGLKMIESTNARKITYSLKNSADYKCKVVESQNDGMLLSINNSRFWVKIMGLFNVYNILATYAVARQFGFDHNKILTSLSCLDSPEGRFQVIKSANSVIGIVDYAHTEDALNNVLLAIQAMKNKNNKLITVIGCGGDRDKSKRGHIAQVACKLSTQVIFTADNPRSEEPIMIIDDMTSVLDAIQYSKVLVIPDRKQAIKTACSLAVAEDIILLAGKGHEKYQEIKGEKVPFDDLVELKESLNIN
tara:strand:+ start:9992 stop:11446 length:1455 start_codon:yes stop_codon:yes gene_type:complete